MALESTLRKVVAQPEPGYLDVVEGARLRDLLEAKDAAVKVDGLLVCFPAGGAWNAGVLETLYRHGR